jgi:hypothetical protein
VSTITLQANHHWALPFTVPQSGKIRFDVDSELPTTTLVLDDTGLVAFRSGKPPQSYGGFANATKHKQEITLPFRGMWYMVVVNYNTVPTAVHCDVWSE